MDRDYAVYANTSGPLYVYYVENVSRDVSTKFFLNV